MDNLTDGFVPEWFVRQFPRGMATAKKLVGAGLWKAGKKRDDNGWWFHDWKPECTKAEIEKAREQARLRKQKSREAKLAETADVTPSVTRDETRDSRMPSRGCLGPTQPNPTQPNPISTLVASSGGVTSADAREAPPPCRRHPNGTDAPCRACGARREWQQRREADDELDARRRAREIADNCPDCHGTNLVDVGPNRVRKCDHQNSTVAHA